MEKTKVADGEAEHEDTESERNTESKRTQTVALSYADNLEVARDLVRRHQPRSALQILETLRSQHNKGTYVHVPILESEALLELGRPKEALSALEKANDIDPIEIDDISKLQWSRNKGLAKLRVGRLLSAREDFKEATMLEAASRQRELKEVKRDQGGEKGLMLQACRLELQQLKLARRESKPSIEPGQGEDSQGTKESSNTRGVLQAREMEELRILMSEKNGENRNAERCAHIVQPLRFFRRFSMRQTASFLSEGYLIDVPAAAYIVRQGDPAGPMYVLIQGVVCVEILDSSLGSEKVIVNTLYDGQVFGELASITGFEAKRTASVLAQEDTVLLVLDPGFYFRVISDETEGGQQGERQDILMQLPMFEGCKRLQLMSLASNLEVVTYRYDERVLTTGQRPQRFLVLTGGICDLVVDKGGAHGAGLLAQSLRPGSTFGHGVLLDTEGHCQYTSNLSVIVISASATFFALTRRSIFYLPDQVQGMILAKLPQLPDPICRDVTGLITEDKRWQRRKNSLFKEMERIGEAPPVLTRPRSASSSNLSHRSRMAGSRKVAENRSHLEMTRILGQFAKAESRVQPAREETLGFRLQRVPMRPRTCGTKSQPNLTLETTIT